MKMKLVLIFLCVLLHTITAVWIKEMESKYLRRKSDFLLRTLLTLISYRNQSIDFFSKFMDWFLYGRDLLHERVKSDVYYLDVISVTFSEINIFIVANFLFFI